MSISTGKRIVLATTLWRRPKLTEIVLGYYRRLRDELANELDLVLLAVGSEGRASRDLCEGNDFDYIETANEPVTYKWNVVIRHARQFEPEGLVLVNSDDVFSSTLPGAYLDGFSKGVDYLGLRGTFIFDLLSETSGLWPGYEESFMQYRVGEPAGCARGFSRRLLDATGWKLWPTEPPRNSIMDFWCTQFLGLFGFQPRAFSMAELGVTAVQLKTDVNITPFHRLPLTDVRAGAEAWETVAEILNPAEMEELARLGPETSPIHEGREGSLSRQTHSGPLPDQDPDPGRTPIYRIRDITPSSHRDQVLADMEAMRRSVQAERLSGVSDRGIAPRRAP